MAVTVGPATHAEVMPLRMAVLRPGQAYEASRYVGEDRGFNLAARDGDRIVGCATFFPQAFPGPGEEDGPPDAVVPEEAEGLVAWRLRGMATLPDLRSAGVGSAVLTAGLAAVRDAGGELVWCNGRTEAMVFYRRHGFLVIGSEFMSGGAEKVAHRRAWVRLRG